MMFQAILRKNGEIFRRWRNEARLGGTVSGVYFKWNGQDYVTGDPLPADAVAAIKDNRFVQLVLSTHPIGEVAAKPKVTITPPRSAAKKS